MAKVIELIYWEDSNKTVSIIGSLGTANLQSMAGKSD
jgi:hypothetical protein